MVEFLFDDKYFQIKSFTQNLVKIKKTILKIKLVTVIFKRENKNIMANTSKNYIDKQITSFFKQRKLMVNQIDSSKNYKITSKRR